MHEGWDKDAQNYTSLMTKIKASGADGIYLGGVSTNNGGQLVKDKVAVVGDNERQAARPGRLRRSRRSSTRQARRTSRARSAPPRRACRTSSTGFGKTFVDDFTTAEGGEPLEVYTVYAATAAQVVLDAISRSDGSREDVIAKLFETDLPDTVVGPMSFNEEGDPQNATETVYLANNGAWEFEETKALE